MNIQASIKVMPTKYISQENVYNLVNKAIYLIEDTNFKVVVGPSETTVEGDYDNIFKLFKIIHDLYIKEDVEQLTMVIITDYNKKAMYIDDTLKNVEENK